MAKKNHHYILTDLFEEQWEDSTKRVLALYNFIERTVSHRNKDSILRKIICIL